MYSPSLQLLGLYGQMPAPEIIGQCLHLLLHPGHCTLYGPKMTSVIGCLLAPSPLLLELPFPTVTHRAALTARRQPALEAAARAAAAGCRGAGDGASSPENRICYPPGRRRAQGRREPAAQERKAACRAEGKAAGARSGRGGRGRPRCSGAPQSLREQAR